MGEKGSKTEVWIKYLFQACQNSSPNEAELNFEPVGPKIH